MATEKLDKKTWVGLRVQVKNVYDLNQTWLKVIALFKQRINDFYLSPIQSILRPHSRKGEGFAIVTLDCALIETFAAFKLGKIYNRGKKGSLPKYEYTSSSEIFVDFLLTESIFENHFY